MVVKSGNLSLQSKMWAVEAYIPELLQPDIVTEEVQVNPSAFLHPPFLTEFFLIQFVQYTSEGLLKRDFRRYDCREHCREVFHRQLDEDE